ncbi:MAG: hypothetical protein JNM63_12130 [Spirochaetia bacterium]|nr:hypothetical protein [Spirochaetia bacterium]
MTREELRENLPDFVRGKSTPQEAAEIESALRSDPGLKKEAESLKLYFKNLERMPRPAAPRDFLAAVKTKIEANQKTLKNRRRLLFLMSGLGSAMALSIGLVMFLAGPFPAKQEQVLAEKNDLTPAPNRMTPPPSGGTTRESAANEIAKPKPFTADGPVFLLAMNDPPRADDNGRMGEQRPKGATSPELASPSPTSGKSRMSASADRSASRKKAAEDLSFNSGAKSTAPTSTESKKSKEGLAADTAPESDADRSGSPWNEKELARLIAENGGLILTNNSPGAPGKKWIVQISRSRSEKLFKALQPHRLASLEKAESEEKDKLKKEEISLDEKTKSPSSVFELQFVFKD